MTPGVTAVAGVLADRYRLSSRIAGGGMGEVWRAHDLVLDRAVAVKTLRTDLDDTDGRTRFRSEARAAARLAHPGIASVYDFGESDESAWLVLELVDGEPLSAVLAREGPLAPAVTLDLVAQAAAALQAAHDGGVVHRDVKPGNLLLRADGTVKVTDFGIASTAGTTTMTRTGEILGTAGYLSPEQADGRGTTAASDVYALGVVAYECLSGTRPFVADTAVAVLYAHLMTAPPPLPSDVPAAVGDLVSRMLAKDPAGRPESAAAVAREATALRAALGRGVAAPGATAVLAPGAAGVGTAVTAPAAVTAARPAAAESPGPAAVGTTAALPVADGPVLPRATSRRTQRRALRATTLVLGVLAVVLGLGGSWREDLVEVPGIAPGTTVARATDVLDTAGLRARQQQRTSPDVPAGRVLAQRPAAGAELERGAAVVLVVSSGPPATADDAAAESPGAAAPSAAAVPPPAEDAVPEPEQQPSRPEEQAEQEQQAEQVVQEQQEAQDEARQEADEAAEKAREKAQDKGGDKGQGEGQGKGQDKGEDRGEDKGKGGDGP